MRRLPITSEDEARYDAMVAAIPPVEPKHFDNEYQIPRHAEGAWLRCRKIYGSAIGRPTPCGFEVVAIIDGVETLYAKWQNRFLGGARETHGPAFRGPWENPWL